MNNKSIDIKGARANNLKDIDLQLPQNQYIVITGVSGSGKSSLAFDTLYAEGQRRYVESLSAYARQFLGRMSKPECDYINNLPPAIAIEQKVNTRNPRSTVGTSTEIYDYMRLLFARVGHTISPVSGERVRKYSVDDIVGNVLSFPEGTRFIITAPIVLPEGRNLSEQLGIYLKQGYSRLELDGEFIEIADYLENPSMSGEDKQPLLLIDRLSVGGSKDERSRIVDSIETAYYEGRDTCIIKLWTDEGIKELTYSRKFAADGIEFREPTDMMFNFNNPYGACPVCEGYGKVMGVSEDLVVPDKSLSVYQDAVQCWRGEKMSEWKRELVHLAPRYGFPVHTPYYLLDEEQKDFLWHGKGSWAGIDGFFSWVDENLYKIQYRVMKARYRGKTICPECRGKRLRKDAEYVKVGGKSISELTSMQIKDLAVFFNNLEFVGNEAEIAERLMIEIRSRLSFMNDVGLGYLTLDRTSATLSGGESQRINLATSLGSSLMGSMYVLDEPSIGLHSRDTERLIGVLRRLRDVGNTVVVVEHDEDIIRSADYLVDIGPLAGRNGGELVFCGALGKGLKESSGKSLTLDYLAGRRHIPVPKFRRPWKQFIGIEGACANNLKNIDVRIPLGVMTVVTGVSGSGKSTLIRDIFYNGMLQRLNGSGEVPGAFKTLSGDVESIEEVIFVNQNPIGTSSRSNPATYLKAYDEIRKLFADQQLARQMGFTPAHFSFNTDGGRCEECKGEGTISISMQFMADINVVCESCGGKRFKPDILEVRYRDKNIDDVLSMTVDQAIEFFSQTDDAQARRIVRRLMPLKDVGLGYICLGQSSSTLSGGENQRVKLAYFLGCETKKHTLFIFDEPTTGLHFHDIFTLLDSLNRLVDSGNSVVIIEHNLDMIKSADWVIDLGPDGGDMGGNLVACGTPEQVADAKGSYTGFYLKEKLRQA